MGLLLAFGDGHEVLVQEGLELVEEFQLALVTGVRVKLRLRSGELFEDIRGEFQERSLEEGDLGVHFELLSLGVGDPWYFVLGEVQWHEDLLLLPLEFVE